MHSNIKKTQELVNAASALVPYLRETALDTERARRVPEETIGRLRDAGLLEILVPRQFGGHEADLTTAARVITELGRGCGSTAWVYGVAASQNWIAATFDLEAQKEVWARGARTVISATYGINPKVQSATRVDAGFRLSGRWGFASGCDHADWHLAQFLAPADGEKPPVAHFALVPRSDFSIEDDWYVMGLVGTGSKTVSLDDVFVPAHRTLAYPLMNSGKTPGSAANANPMYALPLMSATPVGIAATLPGIARGALEVLISTAAAGDRDSARGKFSDHVLAHAWIGEALADIEAAELAIFTSMDVLTAAAHAGRQPTVEERIRIRRNFAFSTRMSTEAAELVLKCTGAAATSLSHQTQRAWRDINAAARHIGLNWETYATQSGRHALGMEPSGLF
ncbi:MULTISPECIES: acyl-CoA dehydrogenase family protein [Rhizobium]|nr:acyl-CoA dehydrogenase family protein [Rhizobium paranaense]